MLSNRADIMYSERSLYKYLDLGMFTARNIDLPRKVRFNPASSNHEHLKVDRKCRIGRTFDDYQDYIREHPDAAVVEIDSVIGEPGGKCLLTIHFVKTELMLAFLRDANTAASVTNIFNSLYKKLGFDYFAKLFPVILTDNGSEFSDPASIETDRDGVIRTRLFYCDPSAPYQKGAAENNHEFIRRVIPKGSSMNELTQKKVDLMMDHINSYGRPELGDKCPYEMMEFMYGSRILHLLGCTRIAPNEVTLNASIFKGVQS
jgi:IS30 family transposase